MSRTVTERANPRPLRRRLGVVALSATLLVFLSACSQEQTDQLKRLGMPEPASDRAPHVADLWIGTWIAAGIVGFFVWGLIGWAVVRYRRRRHDELPSQVRYNLPIEVFYTIAPIVVVAVLFFFTVETQNKVLEKVENPDHEIVVTGMQWNWAFSYVGEDGADGQDVYDVGTPADDADLWLVEGETVNFTLHSPDVIHSFWIPEFLYKQDMIPGSDKEFSLKPTRQGTFNGFCAELCGLEHSRMRFTVHVVSRAEYDAHMAELVDAGQIGVMRGGSDSETVTGLDSEEGSE